MSEVKDVIVQGLWKNNSALVQLLGMCPLLAVTSTATNALGLGLATTLVLTLTNLTISSLRRWTPAEIRIPIYLSLIHISEPTRLGMISYAVFCLKKKKKT